MAPITGFSSALQAVMNERSGFLTQAGLQFSLLVTSGNATSLWAHNAEPGVMHIAHVSAWIAMMHFGKSGTGG